MSEPIRVLQVVTQMNRGGLETMLMNYYRHMDRDRVQFDFLTHRDAPGDYDQEILSLGGRIYHVPRLVPWSRSYRQALDDFLSNAPASTDAEDAHPPYSIIHVHQDCLSAVALKEAQKNRIPVRVAHCHSANQDKNLKYPIKLFYRHKISRYATDLFACGEKAGQWMFCGAPFTVVHNAIDTERYLYNGQVAEEVRQEWHIPENALVVGHVGRFNQVKNHSFLLDVFASLARKEPSARLLLVGGGELKEQAEQKAHTLGLADKVIFTGVRSDVDRLLQAMDVFAFPSLYEGFPVTLVEAQAAGLPCLISDRISAECDLTGLVTPASLDDGPDVWAEKLLSFRGESRPDTRASIVAAGYDIWENARWLQNFYLSHAGVTEQEIRIPAGRSNP